MTAPRIAARLTSRSAHWRVVTITAAVSALGFALGVTFHPGGTAAWEGFDNIGQCLAAAAAALACWTSAARSTASERAGWLLLGTGAGSWCAGQILWTCLTLSTGANPASPSLCDLGFLLGSLLLIAGLLMFVDPAAGGLSELRGALEAMLVAGGLLTIAWRLVISRVALVRVDFMTSAVTLAYPILDAVALSILIFLATRARDHRRGNFAVVALGVASLSIADSSFWYLTIAKGFDGVNASDAGWFVGFLLLAFGGSARGGPRGATLARLRNRPWLTAGLPQGVAIAGLVVIGLGLRPDHGPTRAELWLTLTVGLLCALHGLSVLAENTMLTGNLERRIAERTAALAVRERYFTALIEHSSDTTVVLDSALQIDFVSEGGHGVFGWEQGEAIGRTLADCGPDFASLAQAARSAVEAADEVSCLQWELTNAHGVHRDVESQVRNLLGDPAVAGVVISTRDVTERTALENQLRHQAFHDPLSGLANRALFNDRLEHALARAARHGAALAVLMIDLDGFKHLNDSLGHYAGDEVLRAVADLLRYTTRAGDTVARLGGDEFAVLMEDFADPADAVTAADGVRLAIGEAVCDPRAGGYAVSASIGVTVAYAGDSTAEGLLRDADIAMYAAKEAGRNTVRRFEPSMHDRARDRFRLQAELAGATERANSSSTTNRVGPWRPASWKASKR